METKSFKQWNNHGYRIAKGSKAVGFNDQGEPLFTSDQVYADVYEGGGHRSHHGSDSYYFGGDNPDPMDYDLGLCGQD